MTVALVASSTSGTSDNQQAFCNVPVPAGAAAGHVAVLVLEIWLDTATDPVVTWPSGFTQIAYVESTTDGFQRMYIARKVLTGADSGTYQPTWSGSYWTQGQCTLWSGVDNTTPLDVAVNTAVTAANTTMPAVSVTTAHAGCGMIHLVANENSASGTAPTGYTEQQEANYLRTNTKVAGAAGTETPAGGSISVSTVKLGALVALRAAGTSGNTTAAGTTAETDGAQPAGRIRTTPGGVVAETDAAQPAGRTRVTTLGTLAEVDDAQPAGRTRTTPGTATAETDTALPAGRIRATSLAAIDETDQALPAARVRTTAAGTALETDLAGLVGLPNFTPAGTTGETDTALPAGRARTTTAGTALEADAGQPAGRARTTSALPATELETAQLIGPNHVTPAGTATETDASQPAARSRLTTAQAALELDDPQPASRTRLTAAAAALEDDTAQPITGPGPDASDYLLTGRVETQWATLVETGRYITEVEA